MDSNYDVISFKKAGVVIFASIIKIVTMFIKTILRGSRKAIELEIMYLNGIYICIS